MSGVSVIALCDGDNEQQAADNSEKFSNSCLHETILPCLFCHIGGDREAAQSVTVRSKWAVSARLADTEDSLVIR